MNMGTQALAELRQAATGRSPVQGLTHTFYRYPARFSPLFIRKVIETFTNRGDLIIDPFVGGGTTAVEARALGRRCIGVDINALAIFVSQVKTTPLFNTDILKILEWKFKLSTHLNLRRKASKDENWADYYKNIDDRETWPIRKSIDLALSSLDELSPRQERFARCAILKTSQWALDSKKEIPSSNSFKSKLLSNIEEMLCSIEEYSSIVRSADRLWQAGNLARTTLLNRSIIGIEKDVKINKFPAPRLILTSPPYPGVHILYHRWQVKGRRETPAPYWIANKLDGAGSAYYTFGDRKADRLTTYFNSVYQSFLSLSKLADKNTIIVQMVAFNEPNWQFPMYLDIMNKAGFVEASIASDERIWRQVPNRKWFADQQGPTSSSKEVVLFHQKHN